MNSETKINRQIKDLKTNLRKKSANTKRLYLWQAKGFLKELQEKQIDPTEYQTAALNYLRQKRRKKSRSDFLQACSAVSLLLEKVLRRPFAPGQVEKLQSIK